MPRYAAAIFDLDGTLLDTERLFLDAGLSTLRALGHPVSRQFLISLVGIAEAEGQRRLLAHIGPDADLHALNTGWSTEVHRLYAQGIPVMTSAGSLLTELSARRLPRAVATNSATANARRKLTEAGLAHHFDPHHIVGFDAVAAPKPAPDVFLAAAARLGVAAADCVAFEDSETGVAAALAAGMTVVHIPDMSPADTRPAGRPGARAAHHLAATILDGARACGLIP